MDLIQRIGSFGEGRSIRKLADVVGLVNTFEPELEDLSDGELRVRYGQNGLNRARSVFDRRHMIDRFTALVESVVSAGATAHRSAMTRAAL